METCQFCGLVRSDVFWSDDLGAAVCVECDAFAARAEARLLDSWACDDPGEEAWEHDRMADVDQWDGYDF